ncbi:T9SS type A sorting domain-containing protein [Winogradskyella sp. SM1960]|uniref:T9SS type A sorting domain-containing protein n=1 Tax=Winogradskyella sp. SM1960 TaxID=2865955 RepID=UPI001CD2E6E2|nr:T9SS type A sorting domain-containing protein [Winogradskyella sp. SM1960]
MLKNYNTTKHIKNFFHKKHKLCLILAALFFGTSLIAQAPELVSSEAFHPRFLTEYDGLLFFCAQDADGKEWLWSTDGITTVKYTGSATEEHPGTQPHSLTVLNDQLIFSAVYREEEEGNWNRELFKFDGTEPVLIKNINPNGASAPGYGDPGIFDFGKLNDKLYFTADNGSVGSELWTTDGTEGGTHLVANIALQLDHSYAHSFVEYNGKLLFTAKYYYFDRGLHITDGTTEGTSLVKDISSGSGTTQIRELTAFNNKIYFAATGDSSGNELWVTDGTESGTHMVKNIGSFSSGSKPSDLTVYNGKLYFSAEDETYGRELWVSDGTEAGTELFIDFNTGVGGAGEPLSGDPVNFIENDGKLYFGASNEEGHNSALWATDGTVAGTVMVNEFNHNPLPVFSYDDNVYFVGPGGTTTYRKDLWVSDGTSAGTQIVEPDNTTSIYSPIYIGNNDHLKSSYKIVNGVFYFTANYGTTDSANQNRNKLYKIDASSLSVNTPKISEFSAYPNPVIDVLHLDINANHIQKINLFSITGQSLKSWDAQSEIDLSQFASGIYFVKITTGDNQTMIKRVVKN